MDQEPSSLQGGGDKAKVMRVGYMYTKRQHVKIQTQFSTMNFINDYAAIVASRVNQKKKWVTSKNA